MPQILSGTSAKVLEFDVVRDLVRGYAASDIGRARVQGLAPRGDLAWIENQQQLTAEIRQYRRAGGDFQFSGLGDIAQVVEKSRISGVALEGPEILTIIALIDRAAEWREIALHPPERMDEWNAIRELSSGISDFSEFLRSFRNKILPDGTLDNHASSQLAGLRREIEKQRQAIQESLRSYLRRLSAGGALQEEVVTIRGERFVIPVKAEQKRRVQGVVHGVSSSGQTVFIEPLDTIEQNNELIRLLEEEQAEVRRILLEMTGRIGQRASEIATACEILSELELQFAKARFAEDYHCVRPLLDPAKTSPRSETADAKVLILRQARHPLLERSFRLQPAVSEHPASNAEGGGRVTREVVPITVELENGRRELIITGPNTGGKTVALKTVGLLSLMAQAGLPVPASHMEIPIFDSILADIGDEQSIEQNLSTFSSHIKKIDWISRTATTQSLVLLDELGSATDPEEGAALAVAIAERFLNTGCFTIISTHHTSLKVFAANSRGAINAAVGFDEGTLQPTYELTIGIPGASAGINIAQRLGLNPSIVQSARQRLGTQARDVAQFIDRLHAELRAAERERLDLRAKEEELNRERARLASEGKREQQEKVRELEKKLATLLRDFEYHAREAVSAIEDRAAAQKASKDAERRMAKLRRDFREQFDSAIVAHSSGADRGDPDAHPGLVRHVSQGDLIKLKSMGRSAKVTRRLDDNHFEVTVGAMKMRISREDIAEVITRASETPVSAARAKGVSVSLAGEPDDIPAEINVIGHNVDDATREVEKFLDRAFLAGMPRVRIVHGSGMGVLRKALRQYLQQHPHVQSIVEPPQSEGGAGATVAELRV